MLGQGGVYWQKRSGGQRLLPKRNSHHLRPFRDQSFNAVRVEVTARVCYQVVPCILWRPSVLVGTLVGQGVKNLSYGRNATGYRNRLAFEAQRASDLHRRAPQVRIEQ